MWMLSLQRLESLVVKDDDTASGGLQAIRAIFVRIRRAFFAGTPKVTTSSMYKSKYRP